MSQYLTDPIRIRTRSGGIVLFKLPPEGGDALVTTIPRAGMPEGSWLVSDSTNHVGSRVEHTELSIAPMR